MKTSRKYYLKNRIFKWLLSAILVQSTVFGVALMSMGLFSQVSNEPFQVMRSNLEEKNSFLSDNMNSILLEGDNLKQQLETAETQEEMQGRLMDTLSRMNYVSEILLLSLDTVQGIGYRDIEPNVYSPKGSDIFCTIGQSRAATAVALSGDWKYELEEAEKEQIKNYAEAESFQDEWLCKDGAIYYIMLINANKQMVVMAMDKQLVGDFLTTRKAAYGGMQAVLLSGGKILAGMEASECRVLSGEDEEILKIERQGEAYIGVKAQLQSYGRMKSQTPWYIGMVCREAAVKEKSRRLVLEVFAVYMVSILIAIFFSWYAIRFLLKPLNQLHCDITGQNAEKVHFEESRIYEIDHIYSALNSLAGELEETYSRYVFAMEAAEETIGSFEYKRAEKRTYLTPPLKRILDIPEQWCESEKTISDELFRKVFDGLKRLEEMDGFIFTDRTGKLRCVSIKTKNEENGMFGVVIDKTADYQQICRLRSLSEHDQLTGLYNAGYIRKEGARLLAENKDKVNAAIFCDLDNLKYVNDHFGHNIGDKYIVGMSEALREMARGHNCICARMSGDEFAVLFYGFRSVEEIKELVEGEYWKKKAIETPDGGKYMIRASVGLAYAEKGEGIGELLEHADKAMYIVKNSTKNGISVYKK